MQHTFTIETLKHQGYKGTSQPDRPSRKVTSNILHGERLNAFPWDQAWCTSAVQHYSGGSGQRNKARKIILMKDSLFEKEDGRLPLFAEDMQKILRNPQKSSGTSQ